MAESQLVAVIMAGGSGTRFWPLSTPAEPKQFLRLLGEETMLQATWRRLDGLVPTERRLIITGAEFVEESVRELPGLQRENVIGEPQRRDTAAAAILGTAVAAHRWPGATVLTLPADHLIEPAERFRQLTESAAHLAQERQLLCTIGIRPLYPADCYGYIERGEQLDIENGLHAYTVERFAEKPTVATAAEYLGQGTFYWNAGIFIWPSDVLLAEAELHLPEHAAVLTKLAGSWGRPEFQQQMSAAYRQLRRISIDIGVMERTHRAAVVEATFQWSDLGGWLALGDRLPATAGENHARGKVMLDDCHENVVYNSDDSPPLVCIGVDDLVVVQTSHGTLVCHKDRVESIKQAVNQLYG